MTPTPEPTPISGTSQFDVVACLPPIVGIVGLGGLLIAAPQAARSAIMVRLLEAHQQNSALRRLPEVDGCGGQ